MRIICVDDEPLTLEYTIEMCKEISSKISVEGFRLAENALAWARDNPVDVALLDIDLPDMNGIQLAARIKEIRPDTSFVFLTAYREFAYDAYSVRPSGYLLKPVTREALQKEISYAKSLRSQKTAPHIQALTFGNFDLLVDGTPVIFRRSKAKELLAYLVDRQGTSVTRTEVFAALFENELYNHARQKYLDVIIRSMRETLQEYGIGELLQTQRKGMRINPELLDCDMYRFCRGEADAINSYRGEYMASYSWASLNEAYMDRMRGKIT